MKDYLKLLNKPEKFIDLVNYALMNKIPIISYESLLIIKSYLGLIEPKHVLELGTAIGYSALHFASVDNNILVDTIERDVNMYQKAMESRQQYDKNQQITIHFDDALTMPLNKLKSSYDLIFIDAGKAQYQKLFKKYEPLLKVGGLIITDNILFHNLVGSNNSMLSPNLRALTKKIDNYNQWLKSLENYQTIYISVGDGLAISRKVK